MSNIFSDARGWSHHAQVTVVVDTPGWYDPYAERLVRRLSNAGHTTCMVREYSEIPSGDIAFFLSCMRITPPEIIARNSWNFVVHASDLPKGRGFSPMVWQVLAGACEIPVKMIEMTEEVDCGPIVAETSFRLGGHELNSELRELLGKAIEDLCINVVLSPTPPVPKMQNGEPSWYDRRRPADSELNPMQSIATQFDLLRVVDNESYPAYFDLRGHRYTLKIEDLGPSPIHQDRKKNA